METWVYGITNQHSNTRQIIISNRHQTTENATIKELTKLITI
jgi:hypothetical protein